jgi:multidrug efflux pump subunit AcrB
MNRSDLADPVFLRDVGHVHDGWAVQQNIVRNDGRHSVLLSVLKNGNASTVAVVNGVRKVLEVARAAAPPGLSINELFDQSKLVTASIAGVLREGAIAAGLTGLMILLFLGSWRSTLIVLISIPLSILTSIIILYFMGHTLNTMTLGGLALAVGILVDDSTVTLSPERPCTAPPALPCRPWCRRSRSAASSRRSYSSKGPQNSCSPRSGSRSCSPCSRPTGSRGP